MKYTKASSKDIINTSYKGEIDISYDKLVKIFGNPHHNDGYKTEAEWMLKFKDGTIATIYDYKEGKSYNGPSGKKVEDIRDWHIGGFSIAAVIRVKDAIKDFQKKGLTSPENVI